MKKAKIVLIKLDSEENRKLARDLAFSMYIGYKCEICGHVISSLEDFEKVNPICVSSQPEIKLACKECFNKKYGKV